MAGTLLIGSATHSWKEWLHEHAKKHPILVLDPADTLYGPPCRATLVEGEKSSDWRFVGSLDASRNPIPVLTACAALLPASAEVAILTPVYRPTPVMRQLLHALALISRPSRILIPANEVVDLEGWPVGPELVELPTALPPVVQQAQRRARWIEAQEDCSLHEVALDKVSIQGVRMGTGKSLVADGFWRSEIPSVVYAELAGSFLYLVSTSPLEENQISLAMNHCHAQRVHCVLVSEFEHLVCGLQRGDGEPIGLGFVERAEFEKGRLIVRSCMVQGTPVRVLSLGSLRVDGEGKELGEIKPWAI